MKEVLSIRGAAKHFGEVKALDGASIELRHGETLALLGPNGAGKTTMVRALSGRVVLDGGVIELFGEPVGSGDAPIRARLGVVPQEIALYNLLTARENLEAFGRFHGLAGTPLRERVEWALDWTGLTSRAKDAVKGFSGGMKRRLNIACGILHRPEAILLDEPTVGVDPQSRERIWEMLGELKREGASLLLTTHHLDEAEAKSDRIVVVDHGRTIASGTLRELIEKTLGPARTLRVRLASPVAQAPPGFRLDDGSRSLSTDVRDLAADLPAALATLAATAVVVEDLHVEHPTLHGVFLHLTGKDLRE